jgi:multisubunit Na+/H+ antiporter MnhG subunit
MPQKRSGGILLKIVGLGIASQKMNNLEIAVTTIVVLVFIGILTWVYSEDD